MKIKKQLMSLSVLAALAAVLAFAGCQNQGSVSQVAGPDDAGQLAAADMTAQSVLNLGPLSREELSGITMPAAKKQVAEGDLKILKSIDAASLQKRFVTSWYVPLGSSGWAYAGDNMHGKCWLYFPPNAMNQSTTVTIDWESTGFLEGGVTFSPDGTQFNQPVTVWISYKDANLGGINELDLKLWYFNDTTGMWELIGDTVDTANKMVGGLLNHFSRYAIGAE